MIFNQFKDLTLADPKVQKHHQKIKREFDVTRALVAFRRELGLTQRELADLTGVKQPQIARIESGKVKPSVSTLQKLAEGAGYSLEIRFVKND